MSELRYNQISREWVIIATERAKRPRDFSKVKKENKIIPEYKEDCPFCPGNEDKTPEETFRLGDTKAWKVRVTFNKFAALSPNEKKARKASEICRPISISGFGIHEVIIEHPKHNMVIPLMSEEDVLNIIRTYKSRYLSIKVIEGIEEIVIFKNHGPQAGTSLEHSHSQLIATPVVSTQVRDRIAGAANYFDETGQCIFCATLREETRDKTRVILETNDFVSFLPYAAMSPFHIWIFPKRHAASFSDIREEEMRDLACNLKSTLARLYYGLDNPDLNFTIRSIPVNENGLKYFHWYISVIPRVTQPAGFELGTGMFINVGKPEESAEFLRNVNIP